MPSWAGLLFACILAFCIYDGYQRKNNLTHDTLQRFLSDILGEESCKRPSVSSVARPGVARTTGPATMARQLRTGVALATPPVRPREGRGGRGVETTALVVWCPTQL